MGIDPIWIFLSVCEVPDVNHPAATSRHAPRFMLGSLKKKSLKYRNCVAGGAPKCGTGVQLLASALKFKLS